jgi:hypothetical protein
MQMLNVGLNKKMSNATYFTTGGTESDDLYFGGVDLRGHLMDGTCQ